MCLKFRLLWQPKLLFSYHPSFLVARLITVLHFLIIAFFCVAKANYNFFCDLKNASNFKKLLMALILKNELEAIIESNF